AGARIPDTLLKVTTACLDSSETIEEGGEPFHQIRSPRSTDYPEEVGEIATGSEVLRVAWSRACRACEAGLATVPSQCPCSPYGGTLVTRRAAATPQNTG